MGALIGFLLLIFIWRGLGLHHNNYSHKESESEKKRRLLEREKHELQYVKKYHVHPYGDRIEAIRKELFDTNTFTIVSINDELYVVGHTLMMPCKDIWEAKRLQYRNLIEYSRR